MNLKSQTKPLAFVISGMHRSGTSALSRTMELVGLRQTSDLVRANDTNPSGHWEPIEIVEQNDDMLAQLGFHWADPKPLPIGWTEAKHHTANVSDASSALRETYGDLGGIVVKDPRLSRLFPVWRDAFLADDVEPICLIVCRNPLEVSTSLSVRDDMAFEHAMDLWLTYMLEAEAVTRGLRRVVIHFEDFLKDWHGVLTSALAGFGLGECNISENAQQDVNAFIDAQQRHNHASVEEFEQDVRVREEAKLAYRLFRNDPGLTNQDGFDAVRLLWQRSWDRGASAKRRPNYANWLPSWHYLRKGGRKAQPTDRNVKVVRRAIMVNPENAGYRSQLGYMLVKAGRLEEAEAAFREAIKLNDSVAHAHHALSSILKKTGRSEDAQNALQRAIELDPENVDYRTQLAQLLVKADKLEDAEAAFRDVIRLDGSVAHHHHTLSNILKRLGRSEDALNALQRAAELDPENAEYRSQLGYFMIKANRLEDAEAAFHGAIKLDGSAAHVHHALSSILKRTGRSEDAKNALQRAVELDPENADYCSQLGYSLLKANDLEGAEAAFRDAIRLEGEVALTHHTLSTILKRTGRNEEAQAALQRAVELDPENADLRSQLGYFLIKSNRLEDAEAAFKDAIRLGDNAAHAHHALSTILKRLGRVKAAKSALQKAIELDPENAGFRSQLGHFQFKENNLQDAEVAFRDAIRLDDGVASYHHTLCNILKRTSRNEEARDALQRAVELDPENAGYRSQLSSLFVDANRLPDAETELNKAIVLDDQVPDYHKEASDLLALMGRFDDADAAGKRAVQLDCQLFDIRIEEGTVLNAASPHRMAGEHSRSERQGLNRILAHLCTERVLKKSDALFLDAFEQPGGGALWPFGKRMPKHEHVYIAPMRADQDKMQLSVMIPVFNITQTTWLHECIQSVLDQDHLPAETEIVIVDDASDTSQAETVQQAFGSRVRYVRNDENLGLVGNHNRCLALAKGEFVHILHQDDQIKPGFYNALLAPMLADESIVASFSRSEVIDDKGNTLFNQKPQVDDAGILKNWLSKLAHSQRIAFPAIVVRRSAYESCGGFSPTHEFAFDWEMWARLAAFGSIWCEPEILTKHRTHTASATHGFSRTARLIDELRTSARILSYLPEADRMPVARLAFWRLFVRHWTPLKGELNAARGLRGQQLADFLSQTGAEVRKSSKSKGLDFFFKL